MSRLRIAVLVGSLLVAAPAAAARANANTPPDPAAVDIVYPNDDGALPCRVGDSRPVLGDWVDNLFLLRAAVTDPDLDELTVTFEVRDLARGTVLASATRQADNNGVVAAGFPAETIPDATSFAWRAIVSDGTDETPSRWCEATVDNTVPATPTMSSQDFGTPAAPAGRVDARGTIVLTGDQHTTEFALGSYGVAFPGICDHVRRAVCTDPSQPKAISVRAPYRKFTVCAYAVTIAGRYSADQTCSTYAVQPRRLPAPAHRWQTRASARTAKIADTGTAEHSALVLDGVGWTSAGPPDVGGPSLHFDGTAGVATTTHRVVDLRKSFTISFFAYLPRGEGPGLQRVLHAGGLTVTQHDGYAAIACVAGTCTANPINSGIGWSHYGLTWDAATRTLTAYSNGVPLAHATAPGAQTGVTPLQFGGTTYPFHGAISNPEIYKGILTPGELEEITHP